MRLTGYGLTADLPTGWEGTIALDRGEEAFTLAAAGGTVRPVAHFATFPLPSARGDFGSGAVERMGDGDAFVALLEYGPEVADTPLFAGGRLPRRLDPRVFSPRSLQRGIAGQVGWQAFFTEAGRPFCLYVVLGDGGDAHLLVRRVEQVLATVQIEAAR